MKTTIYNGRLILSDKIIENAYVSFEDKKIVEIGENFNIKCKEGNLINANNCYISPGFIDIHIHGGGGYRFIDATEEAFLKIAEIHAKHGMTLLLPSIESTSDENLLEAMNTFNKLKDKEYNGAKMYGLHLEGPYLNMKHAGGMIPEYIKNPVKENYEKILDMSNGNILRWTVAPELPGGIEFGKILKKKGIIASVGHSDAKYSEVLNAYQNGYELITHLYSAMSTITREGGFRIPGVIESAYIIPDMWIEIIADGCHIPCEMLNMIYRLKGVDKTILITDAVDGAGLSAEEYNKKHSEDKYPTIYEDGVIKLGDRSAFSGSCCTADRLIKVVVEKANIPLVDAVKMLSENPAKLIKADNKGKLEVDYDADIVLFDEQINVFMTIVEGRVVHNKGI